jgi:hypothetical protein
MSGAVSPLPNMLPWLSYKRHGDNFLLYWILERDMEEHGSSQLALLFTMIGEGKSLKLSLSLTMP